MEQQEEVQKTEQTEEKPVTQQTETAATEQTQEVKTETEAQETKTEETQVEAPKKFKIKHNGQEVELEESELIEHAQKGFDYGRRMQAVSEIEKAASQKSQMFDQLANNPTLLKMAMAQQMGYDPALVTSTPQQPDPSLEQVNPVLYGQMVERYNHQVVGKQAVEQALNTYLQNAAQLNNAALFDRTRLSNNLDDQQSAQVSAFVQANFKPNAVGMYSEQQLDYAVTALFGKQRVSEAKLNTAEKIQQTIKKAGSTIPATQVKAKQEPKEVSAAKAHLEYIKELQSAR